MGAPRRPLTPPSSRGRPRSVGLLLRCVRLHSLASIGQGHTSVLAIPASPADVARRRRKPHGATSNGGWGHHHQQRRAAIAPLVNAGKATCARCHEPIRAGEEWRLDHNDAPRRLPRRLPLDLQPARRGELDERSTPPRPVRPAAIQMVATAVRKIHPSAPSTSTADATLRSTAATANGSRSTASRLSS